MTALMPGVLGYLQLENQRKRWRDDPVLWAKTFLGLEIWSKQAEILYSIRDNRNTAVAAGHGVGKSFIAAVAVMWWVDTHPPRETFIASTAPSFDQVSILWDNMRNLFVLAEQRYKEHRSRTESGADLGEFLYSDHKFPGYITSINQWKLEDGFTLGQGRKPPDNKEDVAFQGRHAKYLLAIGDEASGISSGFLEALGNLAVSDENRVLLIANPTDPKCAMALIWKSELSNWVRLHISVLESPMITHEEGFDLTRVGGMSGQDYVDQKKEEWGEEDPRYIARVLGEWAFESGNTVFSEEDIQKSIRCVVVPYPDTKPELGMDVGRSVTGDFSHIYAMERGEVWETDPETNKPTVNTGVEGMRVRWVEGWRGVPLSSYNEENLGQAQRAHAIAIGMGASVVKIDAAGMGMGVIDPMGEDLNNGNYTLIEVWGQHASADKRSFENIRAENYFKLKEAAFQGRLDIDPKDEELHDELRGVLFEYTIRGAKKIEAKDSMKRRGHKSPDRADAVWYSCFDVRSMTEGPLAGMKKGDVAFVNPWNLLAQVRVAPGMPL
jgi:hypothetical protein